MISGEPLPFPAVDIKGYYSKGGKLFMQEKITKNDVTKEEMEHAFERATGFMVSHECCSILRALNDEQAGALIKVGAAYFEERELYTGEDPVLKTLFEVVKKMIDQDMLGYAVKCKKASAAVDERWSKERKKKETGG